MKRNIIVALFAFVAAGLAQGKTIVWERPSAEVNTEIEGYFRTLLEITRVELADDANYILLGEAYGELDEKTKALNLAQWKSLKQQKLNGKGHRISQDDGEHYTYYAFTSKKLFCMDMFYRCPNLKLVILPRKGDIYEGVAVAGDSERRYINLTKKKAKN